MRKKMTAAVLAMAVAAVALPRFSPAQVESPEPTEEQKNNDPANQAEQAEVPVRQVVLFSSGVGYFEHFGTVTGDGSTELRFKTQQINDILKSLVLQDMDGGKITTITYPSLDPVEKTLRSFQVDITGNPSLAELLNQLRGAKLTATTEQNEEITGVVLGVEKRQEPVGDEGKQVREVSVLNLLIGGGIRSVKLDEVRKLQLEDPALREELERALAALTQARDQDKKPVTINFRGEGERRVRVGYVVETPIWKTSYRLILSEEAGAENEGDAEDENEQENALPAKRRETGRAAPKRTRAPLALAPDVEGAPNADAAPDAPAGSGQLQGWAIVENQTDSDWNNVQLSLVSGRPISFIQDLYQPLYIPRPVVEPELYASLRPQSYDAGLGRELAEAEFAAREGRPDLARRKSEGKADARLRRGAAAPPAQAGAAGELLAMTETPADDADYDGAALDPTASVASVASATDVGELFQYTVGSVSLPRQKSAMIPIVADAVEVERLSIYNPTVLARHPLIGARMKNTSGKHLLQGPVTVFEAGTYAGDARIDDVPPGQERLLSFGIDQQILVDAGSNKQEQWVVTGKIVKGVLQVTHKSVFTQDYIAQNKGEEDKTLLIEHPRREGWSLIDTQEPVETTEQLYRFKGQAPAGKQTKLTVKEELVRAQMIEIMPADIGVLEGYLRTGKIPDAVKEALSEAIELKYAMVETERQIQERQTRINEISNEQTRIRENIKTVQPNRDYYNRLTKKLDEQETEIEKLQGEIEALLKQRDAQRKALEDYVAGLNIE